MKHHIAIVATFLALAANAEYIRQATETYPGGGGGGGGGVTTNDVRAIVAADGYVKSSVTNGLASEEWVEDKDYATNQTVEETRLPASHSSAGWKFSDANPLTIDSSAAIKDGNWLWVMDGWDSIKAGGGQQPLPIYLSEQGWITAEAATNIANSAVTNAGLPAYKLAITNELFEFDGYGVPHTAWYANPNFFTTATPEAMLAYMVYRGITNSSAITAAGIYAIEDSRFGSNQITIEPGSIYEDDFKDGHNYKTTMKFLTNGVEFSSVDQSALVPVKFSSLYPDDSPVATSNMIYRMFCELAEPYTNQAPDYAYVSNKAVTAFVDATNSVSRIAKGAVVIYGDLEVEYHAGWIPEHCYLNETRRYNTPIWESSSTRWYCALQQKNGDSWGNIGGGWAQGPNATDPDAVDILYPNGTPTHRYVFDTVKDRLATTNDIAKAMGASYYVTNTANGAYVDADLGAHIAAPATDWNPKEYIFSSGSVSLKYNNIHWDEDASSWMCDMLLKDDIHTEWTYQMTIPMLGDGAVDPEATYIMFPQDEVPTSRTKAVSVYTRLATTNDVLSAKTSLNNKIDGVDSRLGTRINQVTNRVGQVEAYLGGQNVRVSVTNVNGSAMGDLPKLRIEENVSNVWNIVWDEDTKYGTWYTNATAAVASMTGGIWRATQTYVTNAVATKAPLAWGTVTSAGSPAPDNTVWHTAGKTVFGGGTEFTMIAVGTGQIGVLANSGAVVYAEGNPGTFMFETSDFRYHFGMRVEDSYMLGCDTDAITTSYTDGNALVTLTYNVTMSGKPCLYYKRDLSVTNGWEKLNDSTGAPIPGASVGVSWETTPAAGHEVAYINCATNTQGFFTACVEVAGVQSFETNLAIDPQGGILATNTTTGAMAAIEPYIESGAVKWRIKP